MLLRPVIKPSVRLIRSLTGFDTAGRRLMNVKPQIIYNRRLDLQLVAGPPLRGEGALGRRSFTLAYFREIAHILDSNYLRTTLPFLSLAMIC